MNKPKKNISQVDFQKLYLQNQDKEITEALIKRLSDLLVNDPKKQQKAALILESWMHQKK